NASHDRSFAGCSQPHIRGSRIFVRKARHIAGGKISSQLAYLHPSILSSANSLRRSKMPKLTPTLAISIVVALVPAIGAVAQQQELEIPRNVQSVVTEIWEPVPEKVDAQEGELPSDAIVLFDGTNLDAWESVDGGPAEWTIADDIL